MSENLGTKIKLLRETAGLKWGDLAEAAGIDVAQIVLIESGEAEPALSVLLKIARRMGVRLGTLLDGTEERGPVVSNPAVLKPTVKITQIGCSNHLDFYSLAGQKSDRNMEPFVLQVDYADPQDRKNYASHEGEEFIYILEGELLLYYGTEKYLLEAGKSIYFDSIVPHCLSAASTEAKARVLLVTYTPN